MNVEAHRAAKEAKRKADETASAVDSDKAMGIDPNASRYNIRRRIAEESKKEADAQEPDLSEDPKNSGNENSDSQNDSSKE